MLNVQEYRHELDAMSENIQELSVSLGHRKTQGKDNRKRAR